MSNSNPKTPKTFTAHEIEFLYLCLLEDNEKIKAFAEKDFKAFQASKFSLIGYVDARYSLLPKGKVLFGLKST